MVPSVSTDHEYGKRETSSENLNTGFPEEELGTDQNKIIVFVDIEIG